MSLASLLERARTGAPVASAQLELPGVTQRWRERRDLYRTTGDRFSPADWRVDVMLGPGAKERARDFVVSNHYAATYPQTRVQVGLYHARSAALVGVASFGNGPRGANEKYGDVGIREIAELNRFVLLDEVPGNAETWFLSRAFGLCEQALSGRGDTLKVVLSYSDPVPRRDVYGHLTMPGHIGNIYQARNAIFVGRSRTKPLFLDSRGVAPDGRMLSKIKSLDGPNPERGARAGAQRFVQEFGAPQRKWGEAYGDWISRALSSGGFRRVAHAGNLVYLWALGDKRAKRQIEASFPESQPYPKTPRQRYVNLQRRYERAWSRGALDEVSSLAEQMLSSWLELTSEDRVGVADPPQVGVTCAVGRGSSNQTYTLDQLVKRAVC